ncbi:hypothetical protein HNY73_004941 [Argiope bruennichi]|uniref:Uncharacterized protein n=1 Tax=Argiope bruennichi TaxID=94029 RepID=A0A8T0FQK7_ARGBR|nr:hypothetical protein HNY73_004941 [Argiope bruennichi]
MSKQGDRLGSSDFLQIETSLERHAALISKTSEMSILPQDGLLLATDFCLSQNQFVSSNLCSDEETKHLPMSFPLFKNESPDTKKCLFELKAESSRKYWIPSDEDNNIQNYFPTNSSNVNNTPFKFCNKEESALGTSNFCTKTLGNISHSAQKQALTRVCESKPSFTTTLTGATSKSYKSDQCGRTQNAISKSSLSNESTSSSDNQHSSDGYLAGESNTSDISGNAEIQSDFLPVQTAAMTSATNLPFGSEYYYADGEGDTTLHKCFHWGTQSSPRFYQGRASLATTFSELAPARFSLNHRARRRNQACSLSSETSSSSTVQQFSDDYLAGESNTSDDISGNEEFQSDLSPLRISTLTYLDSSPSESEYYYADWEGDTTLKSLIDHKCFHCGTKCFSYVIYVLQQVTRLSLDQS